jgi:hypothetical protein
MDSEELDDEVRNKRVTDGVTVAVRDKRAPPPYRWPLERQSHILNVPKKLEIGLNKLK